MTIIQPHKNRDFKYFVISFFALLFIGGGLYIFQYNALVNTKYQIDKLKESLTSLQVKNADLKNELYGISDPVKLQMLASSYGLTLDRRPEYLENAQWLSDSSR